MNTKEILQKLKDVFAPEVEETQLSEIEVQKEEVSEEVSEVELAEAPMVDETPKEDVSAEPRVEYATKLELEEMKRKFMDLFEAFQKETETKKEVPQELSSEVEEVELSAEEIAHSPELEVEKKFDLHKPKLNNQSIQSSIYSKLFK